MLCRASDDAEITPAQTDMLGRIRPWRRIQGQTLDSMNNEGVALSPDGENLQIVIKADTGSMYLC
jgi:hypothetical protein